MNNNLSKTILKSVAIRLSLVIILSSGFAYFHIVNIIEKGATDSLENFVTQKVHNESFLFELTAKNHKLIKEDIEATYKLPISKNNILRFDREIISYPDGTYRNRSKNFDGSKNVQVYIPPKIKITPEFKNNIVNLMDIVLARGTSYLAYFDNTYITTKENILIMYWPKVPNWTIEMKSDIDLLKDVPYWVADQAHNPKRNTVWTALYFDQVPKIWMVSGVTPLDINHKMEMTISHDVMMSSLIERTNTEHIAGTYNLIFREDGRLVVHKDKMKELIDAESKYDITTSKDNYLKTLYHSVINLKSDSNFLFHPLTKDLIVFKKFESIDWYFVTVYPYKLLAHNSLGVLKYIILLGLLSLIIEIIFISNAIKEKVLKPIADLTKASNQIQAGNYQVELDLKRDDQIGELAMAFDSMIKAVESRDKKLNEQASSLALTVQERTRELDEQRMVTTNSSKMVTLGEMAAGVAHEINNPLAVISGNVSLLKRYLNESELDKEKAIKSINTISNMSVRINKIIKSLLYFARKGDNDPFENVLVADILNDAIELLHSRFTDKDVKLICDYSDDIIAFECRKVQITQVIVNLISNAIDAIENLPDRWIKATCSIDGDIVTIKIIDSGTGIDKKIYDKLFVPFFTTKEVGKGTGIGLSISKGIIEQHQGTLDIDLKEVNTTFVITLPLQQNKSC